MLRKEKSAITSERLLNRIGSSCGRKFSSKVIWVGLVVTMLALAQIFDSKKILEQSTSYYVSDVEERNILRPPRSLDGSKKETALLNASDIRGRDPRAANIFYFDARIPCRNAGAGFPRSVDNIKMLIELGHRVTVASALRRGEVQEECLDELRGFGAEVIPPGIGKAYELVMARQGFYEVLLVSRSDTFKLSYAMWRDYLKNNPLAIVFDSEAFTYRRDVKRMELLQEGIRFPSLGGINPNTHRWRKSRQETTRLQAVEEQLIEISDIVITVSEREKKIARETIQNVTNVEVIGHVIEPRVTTNVVPFKDRKGILYFGSFSGSMYYNGDAIWYFLKEIYPKILEEIPISLTIAGRKIPNQLREFTKNNGLDGHVKFLESVKDISSLYDSHRVFVAPHLYGAGVQFKLSESLAMGIVTVMSRLSADAFDIAPEDEVTCIGEDPKAFSRCVIGLHSNETAWTKMQQKGFEFIEKTHNQALVKKTWAKIIDNAKDIQGRVRKCRSEGNQQEERECTSCDDPPGHCKIFEKPELA